MVFVLIISAALRYGDIDDEEDNSSFQEFYPHPVDIYEYLLNFVCEIENIITISYERDKSSFLSKCFPDNLTLKYNKAYQEIQRKITSYHMSDLQNPTN
ncbi:MAG: hypothetical protein QJT81_02175 [Candidatus Thiothrix putei]|uniref:Uncharacterized protein n=1 Tax=Candidatus Thiothrix putei TaxID=3080811 RepID=A0AA95HCM0_9GAMM|nr:MAG: hypothetical protein QJT81_02175 [Candidatus Thiothrix putei]